MGNGHPPPPGRARPPRGRPWMRALPVTATGIGLAVGLAGPAVQVTVHGLRVEEAAWRFARMRTTPQIGFLAALTAPPSSPASRRPPVDGASAPVVNKPPVAGGGGGRGPGFRIADAKLEGLE